MDTSICSLAKKMCHFEAKDELLPATILDQLDMTRVDLFVLCPKVMARGAIDARREAAGLFDLSQ